MNDVHNFNVYDPSSVSSGTINVNETFPESPSLKSRISETKSTPNSLLKTETITWSSSWVPILCTFAVTSTSSPQGVGEV